MKQIGKNNSRHAQVYVNQFYDVVAQNGIVIGSVRYAFANGDGMWCIAITGHNGMPYYGESPHETECVFDLREGEPPWTMPVAQAHPQPPAEAWDMIKDQAPSPGFLLLTKENPS